MSQLLAQWARDFSVDARRPVMWVMGHEEAERVLGGGQSWHVAWWMPRRERVGLEGAPWGPSDGVVRHVAKVMPRPVVVEVGAGDGRRVVWGPRRGFVRSYAAEHRIRVVRAARWCGDKSRTPEMHRDILAFHWGEEAGQQERDAPVRLEDLPGTQSIVRSTVLLDQAAMLYWRRRVAAGGYGIRYLAFDGSPQHGDHLFATVERVLDGVGRDGADGGGTVGVQVHSRLMPLSVLGHCRQGLAEKTQALLHQTWLEYGPSLRAVRRANGAVRVVLTDMGVEFGVSEVWDVVPEAVGRAGPLAAVGPQENVGAGGVVRQHLFPWAFGIPGTQHIVDAALKGSFDSLGWWDAFVGKMKVVSQWLHAVTHRRYLQGLLPVGDPMRPVLDRGCERFAQWRWQTLGKVTADLLFLEKAVRHAAGYVGSAKDLEKERRVKWEECRECVRDEKFWDTVAWTGRMLEPLKRFGGWLKGCDCHEEDRLAGREVTCPWQGCRARGLAVKVESVLEEMRGLREVEMARDGDADLVLGRMIHKFGTKMAWVSQQPALLWQAWDRAVAGRIVVDRDRVVGEGGAVHRVTERFTKVGSRLRADLSSYAAGHVMTQTLRRALLEYALANVDDTWAETSHRDVSHFSKTHASSKVPYMAASYRTTQVLDMYKALDGPGSRMFRDCLTRTKELGRCRGARQERLATQRWRRKDLNAFIYRFDSTANVDWAVVLRAGVLRAEEVVVQQTLGGGARVRKEYLEYVLQEGGLYSVSAVGEEVAAAASRTRYFKVLDKKAGGMKVAGDQRPRGGQGLVMGLQWLEPVLGGLEAGQGEGGGEVVRTVGDPVVVNVLEAFEWKMWVQGLRQCGLQDGETAGNMALTDGVAVKVDVDWKDPKVPAWSLVERLVEEGWRVGAQVKTHRVDSPKDMRLCSDAVSLKGYLRCLLGLASLQAAGLEVLDARGLVRYYQCVLASPTPRDVPQRASAVEYGKILDTLRRGGIVVPCEGSESADELDDGQVDGGGRSAVASSLVLCEPGRLLKVGRSRKRLGDAMSGVDKRPRMQDGDWKTLLGLQEASEPNDGREDGVEEASVVAERPVDVLPLQQAEDASAAARREVGASHAAEASEAGGGSAVAVQPMRLLVEGVELTYEPHGMDGRPGSYRRLIAQCPHHTDCGTSRVFSVRFGRLSGLGDNEPHAFLGAWLRGGRDLVDDGRHMGWKPKVKEVQAYALSVGGLGLPT